MKNSLTSNQVNRFNRNLRIAYSQFKLKKDADHQEVKLKYLWEFIEPLLLCIVFYFLHRYKTFGDSEEQLGYPFVLFVVIGVMTWQSILDAIHKGMIAPQKIKKWFKNSEILPGAVITEALISATYSSIIRFAIIIFILAYTMNLTSVSFILGLIVFFQILMLSLSFGLFAGSLAILYSDISYIVNLSLRILFFVSGIVFPIENIQELNFINYLNPVLSNVALIRDTFLFGPQNNMIVFIFVTIIIFFIVCRFFIISVQTALDEGYL